MKPFDFFITSATSNLKPLTREEFDKVVKLMNETEKQEEARIAFEVFLISPKRRGIITGVTE